MEPWIIDASDICKGNECPIEKDDIVTNKDIETFINNEYLRNVVAPKGFGKTFLLLYKRLIYTKTKEGCRFIPKNNPIDSSSATNFVWGKLMNDFYSNHTNWENLWKCCISLSLIKLLINEEDNLKPKHNPLYNKIKDIKNFEKYELFDALLYKEHYNDPTEYLKHIVNYFSVQEIQKLLAEENFLNSIVKDIEIPIVIFIDNVDELFREYLKEFKDPDGKTVFSKNIWHFAQQGLVLAAKDMCRTVRHLDMYVSIRKEAFDLIDDDLLENLRSSTIVLNYSDVDLENIFKKNIKWMDKKFLVAPEKQDADPIMSFFGFDKIKNKYVGEDEDIFKYIYRHTLKRPRDVVHIGRELSNMSNAERQNPEKVRMVINKTATTIAEDYIKIFVRYTDFKDVEEVRDFLRMIKYNVLSWKHMVNICSRFNNGCDNKNCEDCNKKHVFCSLFQLGLLGVTYFDAEEKCKKQRFLCPGEERFKTKHVLPKDSNPKNKVYYLIHPILNGLIGGDHETNKDKTNIIGDGRVWKDIEFPKFMQIKQVFLCHSEKDKNFVDRVYKDLLQRGVDLWYDKYNIKVGDSIVDKINEGIDNSDYLIIFISKNSIESGWVRKELDAGVQKEIDEKKIFVLPALIIDEIDKNSWKKLPPMIRNKKYADFRKDYDNGLKGLIETIKVDR